MKHLKLLAFLLTIALASATMMALSGTDKAATDEDVVFTGMEDHDITLQEAIVYTQRYQSTVEDPTQVLGGFFGKETLQRILDQEDCVGIRYYYAKNENGQNCLVLVGADAYGNDMTEGYLAERSVPCPPGCELESFNSPLVMK